MPLSVEPFVANLSQTGLMSAADALRDRLPPAERPAAKLSHEAKLWVVRHFGAWCW
jgi:hypothetical protein